jgi:hypothetical protein
VKSALSGITTLVSVSCLMLGLWRLTADVGWTDEFAIQSGLLSHWQVWLALAIAFGAAAMRIHGEIPHAQPSTDNYEVRTAVVVKPLAESPEPEESADAHDVVKL